MDLGIAYILSNADLFILSTSYDQQFASDYVLHYDISYILQASLLPESKFGEVRGPDIEEGTCRTYFE
jgi:hypothetical protein